MTAGDQLEASARKAILLPLPKKISPVEFQVFLYH
jgi:hypothetical protein